MSAPADSGSGPVLKTSEGGGVLTLTLNRPEKRNALSIELREAIAGAFGSIDTGSTGCVVLTGAGSAFCSGMDTTQFGGDREHRHRLVESSLGCFDAVARSPVPVVAAVNGPALAGGFVLALSCDIRIAAEGASFGYSELPRGIPPAYASARAALPAALARELCTTGRMVDAREALARGVVSHVAGDPLAAALELAGSIAAKPRPAVLETRRRIILERDRLYGFLFDDEQRMFRAALLGDDG